MNQLKFSHNYLKLPNQWIGKKATLLFVREIDLEKQTPAFLNYDTLYEITEEKPDGTVVIQKMNYPLPKKGKYLLLLFECEGTVFTTLRRSTPEKKLYYEKECEYHQEFELAKS